MSSLFIQVLNMSFMAGITACVVIFIRLLLKKAPKIFSYALWSVVLFRLLCPFTFESIYSLMPANPNTVPQTIVNTNAPSIKSNIQPVDDAVNFYLATNIPDDKDQDDAPAMLGIMEVCAFVWLIGMVSLFSYTLFSYLSLKRRLEASILVRDNIYETDRITTPFVLGFIKPQIYIPIGVESIGYILKHEQTHIRRRDHLIKPIAFLALCLHWFNPVIWLSYFLMCKDMEMSCDESVLKHSTSDIRADYSGSLLSLSASRSGLLSPLAFGESNTKTRIKNVLRYKKPALWISIIAIIVVLGVTVGFMANRAASFNYEEVYQEATHFSTDEPDPASISRDAFEHYFAVLSSNDIPDEYRYSDVVLLGITPETGDAQEFTASLFCEYKQYRPGEGIPQEDGSFFVPGIYLVLHIKYLEANNYEIISVETYNNQERIIGNLTSEAAGGLTEQIKGSIQLSDEGLLFTIPYTDGKYAGWNIWIAGRSEYSDGFSRSEHYLGSESATKNWTEGQSYLIPVTPEQAVNFTELTMDIYIPGEDGTELYTVDLLPFYLSDGLDTQENKEKNNAEHTYFGDYKKREVEEFALEVKDYILNGNKTSLSQALRYPITVTVEGIKTTLNSSEDFMKNYDKIINQPFKNAISEASAENMFSNYMGVMIGNGEIWFENAADRDGFQIIAINSIDTMTADEAEALIYTNDRLGFSVEFPAYWDGLIEISENYVEYDERGGAGIAVHHKASRETANPNITGTLFYIERWIGTWVPENPPIYAGGCFVVLETGKYTYMLRTTSGVEYNENDPQMAAECQRLLSMLDTVQANVRSVDSVYAGTPAEKEFLDSSDGKQLRETSYDAAKAMLKADADELVKYLVDPSRASRIMRNVPNVYDDLTWLCFKFTLDSIISDDEVRLSYEYCLSGEDSYTYVSMTLKKVSSEWKVSEIGLEK